MYMLQPDPLLHTECEEERKALFLFFEDYTNLYACMQRINWQKLFHLGSANHIRCDTENDESAESYKVGLRLVWETLGRCFPHDDRRALDVCS